MTVQRPMGRTTRHRFGTQVPRFVFQTGSAGYLLRAGIFTTLTMALAAGCMPGTGRRAVGNVQVKVAAVAPMTTGSNLEVQALLSKDNTRYLKPLAAGTDGWSTVFSGVYTGRWKVEVMAFDKVQQRQVLYGATTVLVEPDRTAVANVTLGPARGWLEVEIDLAGFQERSQIQMCYVRLSPSVLETNDAKIFPDANGAWKGKWFIPAGTYDLSIELYNGLTMTNSLKYASPYQRVDIEPGRLATVRWSVQTGTLTVNGTLDPAPGAPTGLSASVTSEGIVLEWQPPNPVPADLQGYVVYVRHDLFERFEATDTVPAGTLRYVYQPRRDERGRRLAFAVSARDGLSESPRSSEVEVVWEPAS